MSINYIPEPTVIFKNAKQVSDIPAANPTTPRRMAKFIRLSKANALDRPPIKAMRRHANRVFSLPIASATRHNVMEPIIIPV